MIRTALEGLSPRTVERTGGAPGTGRPTVAWV
jgi:hypothetical protein